MGRQRTQVERLRKILPDPQGQTVGLVPAVSTYLDDRGITQYTYTLTPVSPGSAQTPIQFQDEGVNLGTAGTANVVNFTGAGVVASRVGNTVTVNVANAGTVTSVNASGGTTGLSFSGGPITTSGTLTLSGTLAIANGGTGQVTANAALNALLPTQTGHADQFLKTDGTNTSWAAAGSGTVTSVDVSGGTTGLTTTGGPITTSGTITLAGTLAIANGGTGATTAATARSNLGAQAAVQYQDEGSNLGASGTVTTVNYTGNGVVAARASDTVTLTIPGGAPAAGIYYYGDGSDGTVLMDGTNTFSFASKAGSVYTLTRDLYANTLQINGGAQLKTGNFRIFIYTGILDCTGAASPAIFGTGNNGANATGAALGAGGAQGVTTGTIGQGGAGGGGANGGTGVGGNGTGGGVPGGGSTTSNGGTGGPPGNVSNSGGTGSGGVGGASPLAAAVTPFVWQRPDSDMYVVVTVGTGALSWQALRGGGGGSGGGAGGGNGAQSGGGGGGGGAGGNVIYIAARDIYCGAYLLAAVDGGAGGNGGAGQGAANTGGGGGGNGGGGGLLHIVYSTLSGPGGMTLSANGGLAGNGGNGTTGGNAGKGGTGGTSGLINDFNIGTGVATSTPTNRALVAGSANSGQTGGAGGAAVRTLTP